MEQPTPTPPKTDQEILNEQLRRIARNVTAEKRDEWLRFLHQRYTERFLKDNDRIWTVSSIFIPLSLAGLASVKEGSFITTSLLAIGSIGLMNFWYHTAEKHWAFQEKNRTLLEAIESYIGLDMGAIKEGYVYKIRAGRKRMRRLVIFVWMLAVILTFSKCVIEAQPACRTDTVPQDLVKIIKSLLGIKKDESKASKEFKHWLTVEPAEVQNSR